MSMLALTFKCLEVRQMEDKERITLAEDSGDGRVDIIITGPNNVGKFAPGKYFKVEFTPSGK